MAKGRRQLRREVQQLRHQLSTQRASGSGTALRPRQPGQYTHPIYSSQLPVVDPYTSPLYYGGYGKNQHFWGSYGSGLSFELLRLAARRCLLIQAMHSCCLHEFLQLAPYAPTRQDIGWRIEPTPVMRQQHARELGAQVPDMPPELEARRARVQARFEVPHPLYEPTFAGFLSKILKDHLTINRVCIELIRNQRGQVVQFRAVDGATILPTLCVLDRFIAQRGVGAGRPMGYETAAKMLTEETGHPIRDAEYVCVMRGQLVGTFMPGELLIWEFDPSTDTRELFPPSYVEKALEGIISWIYAFQYNKQYFQSGNPIEVMLGISGAIEDDSFVALQEQLRENFSGIKGAWRVPLVQLPVDGMLSVIKLKSTHTEMQFMEWIDVLISLVCAVYRKHPNRIYFAGKAHEGQAIFEHSREHDIESSEEEGFTNNRIFFGQHLTQLARLLDPLMQLSWSGLDLDDRSAQITIETQEVTHYLPIDELRERIGLDPFNQPWSKVPLNPLIFQAAGLTGGMAGPEGANGETSAPAERVQGVLDQHAANTDQEDEEGSPRPNPRLGMVQVRHRQLGKAQQWEEVVI